MNKEVKRLEQELHDFDASMVTWQDTENGNATMKEYRRDRRIRNKLQSVYLKAWSAENDRINAAERKARLERATVTDIMEFADRLHSVMCTMDHVERCDYHYGNWNDDIRNIMLTYYEMWEKLEAELGYHMAVKHLEVLESHATSKEIFENILN